MEIYTEEQLRRAMEKAMIPSIYQMDLWGQLTPIKLPSDEEIEKKLYSFNDDFACGYIAAIEMIEEQIKQQADGIK